MARVVAKRPGGVSLPFMGRVVERSETGWGCPTRQWTSVGNHHGGVRLPHPASLLAPPPSPRGGGMRFTLPRPDQAEAHREYERERADRRAGEEPERGAGAVARRRSGRRRRLRWLGKLRAGLSLGEPRQRADGGAG